MSTPTKIPRDVQESIRDVMDKKVKVSLKLLVKMETKGDKTENKVLAFTPCRVFILNPKVPSKLENSFHFLDIQSIESKKPNQLALTIDGKVYGFQSLEASTDEMDHIITHIGISLKHIFPSFPIERLIVQIDVQPPERLKVMNDLIRTIEGKATGPCGGFTMMYQCMCDYHGLPFREEVEWDVDTIYLSLDTREFRFQDFDHLIGRDLVPIIAALEHNTWFKALNASNVKLSVEACNELVKVMKRNAVIEEVNLSNTGIKSDFVQKFALALISNSGTQLSSLDISNNLLEDRGISHLLGALSHLPCGLTTFDMSRTGVSTRCLNKVGEVLTQAPNVMASLSTLKLNDNGLKGEDFPLLYNCLAQPNAITYLDLSSTDCALDALCDPLLRGCPSLTTLKAAGTTFTHKRNKDVQLPMSWKQLFTSACCLELVDLSNCRLPPEALKEMLLGLSANRNLKGVYLDISSNDLGPTGAAAIAPCMSVLTGVRGLDISNNGFDAELKSLIPELAKNSHIKQLSLGRNFTNIKPKFRTDVISTVALLLQEETCGLESLSLADSKLKGETTYVINALGSNETLVEIDISGNAIGDMGARMLAKALLINSKLRKVVWDKNNVSAQGFEDVAEALQRNLTLKKMPYPINDAAAALRMYPEKTEMALQRIESYLQRNHSPRRFTPDQAYRLQQGFLISSTQQMVDRLVVKVEDTVNALQSTSSAEAHAGEVDSAQKLVSDANNSKQLLPSLQDIALKSQAAGNPVDAQLQAMADSLKKAIEEQMEKTTEEMLKCTSSHCPAVMSNETFHSTIQEGCQSKSSLPRDFSTGVLEAASTDIYNTTSEMNLAVAALISDSVVDEVIDSLSSAHKSLTTHLNIRKSGLFKDKEEKEEDSTPRLRVPTESSPKFANKRKSVLSRKTRPQSTMGEREDAGLHGTPKAPPAAAAENHVISKIKESSAASSPSGSTERLSDFPELPTITTTSRPLEHVTKARPRREKTHRPTRPVMNTGTTEMEEGPDNGLNPHALSPTVEPTASISPKAPERKDHKARKDQSPSGAKVKQEDGHSGKSESKKWVPSFMKKKEDKSEKEQKEAKKSNSFSSSFSGLFKKRGSEDKKRPSIVAEAPSQPEAKADSEPQGPASHNRDEEDGKKQADTSLEVVKEVEPPAEAAATPEVTIKVEGQPEGEAPAAPNRSPGPVAPRRMLSHDRPAMLPPSARLSGGEKKSPEARRSAASAAEPPKKSSPSLATEEDTSLPASEEQKKAESEAKSTDSSQGPSQAQQEKEKEDKGEDQDSKDQPQQQQQKQEEKEEKKDELPKLPPGVAKMPGLGALGGKNLVQEMKLKQKRFSQKPVSPTEEQKEAPALVLKPAAETNNNTQDTTTTATTTSSSSPASPSVATTAAAGVPAATPSPTAAAPPVPIPPVKRSRPPSAETTSASGGNTPTTPDPSPTKQAPPPRPSAPPSLAAKGPSPAPRVMAASKRPVSVVEAPGKLTAELPSSMTTSTPEFHLDESSSGPSANQRPAPPVKPRPPIMPRPRKRDSAPPTEESSDIPPSPTVAASAMTSPITSGSPVAEAASNPSSTLQAALPPHLPAPSSSASSSPSIPASATTTAAVSSSSSSSSSSSAGKNQVVSGSQKPSNVANSSQDQGITKQHGNISDVAKTNPSVAPSADKEEPASGGAPDPAASTASEEGIVYDSATLRMSVKDKIKRLSKATGAPGAAASAAATATTSADTPKTSSGANAPPLSAKVKAMSLPKNARLPGGSSPNGATDVEGEVARQLSAPIPEEESMSPSDLEQAQQEEVSPGSASAEPAAPVPDDEIMV